MNTETEIQDLPQQQNDETTTQPGTETTEGRAEGKVKGDPMVRFAFALIAIGVAGTVYNLSQALAFASAIGIVAGGEGVVAMCAAQSVKAATAGERFRAARVGMWTVPVVAIAVNLIAAAFAAGVSWDTAFLYALAPLGTCVAAEYIAYSKRQQVRSEDGITELRRKAAAEREKRDILAEQHADAERRENARQHKEGELFYWMSRYEKKTGLSRKYAERKVWELIRTAALDDSERTDRMQGAVDTFLDSWMTSTSTASSSSKWASLNKKSAMVELERPKNSIKLERPENSADMDCMGEEASLPPGADLVPAIASGGPNLRAVPEAPKRKVVTIPVDDGLSEACRNRKMLAAMLYIEEDAAKESGRAPISQTELGRRFGYSKVQVSRSKSEWGRKDLTEQDFRNALQWGKFRLKEVS
ncbi:hypothetical protein ABT282_07925 [Streptomyces sp. NPDC000927]|uniref:hypothetical protein n=1 Tax=Streptomyces sp. NPDC000927 TaxID=3154371 RepID=UPI003325084C